MIRHQLPVYSPVPVSAWAGALLEAVFPHGEPLAELRRKLLSYFRADDALLCGSGTQALQLAIEMALTRHDGSTRVALPAFTCYDVASAAIGAGAPVCLYDIDPDSLAPDEDSLMQALQAGARVVVLAPLYGVPFDIAAIGRLVSSFGGSVIEDAAQCHGASWGADPLGSIADLSVLSFGRGKGWTGGGGGAVLRRGSAPEFPELRHSPRGVAKLPVALFAQWALARPAIYGVPRSLPGLGLGETSFKAPVPPAPMPASCAAALLRSGSRAAAEPETRRRNADSIVSRLSNDAQVAAIAVRSEGTPGFLRLPLRVRGGMRSLGQGRAARVAGIEAGYPTTLAGVGDLISLLDAQNKALPGAELLVRELVTLPTHSRLNESDLERLVHLLRNVSPKA